MNNNFIVSAVSTQSGPVTQEKICMVDRMSSFYQLSCLLDKRKQTSIHRRRYGVKIQPVQGYFHALIRSMHGIWTVAYSDQFGVGIITRCDMLTEQTEFYLERGLRQYRAGYCIIKVAKEIFEKGASSMLGKVLYDAKVEAFCHTDFVEETFGGHCIINASEVICHPTDEEQRLGTEYAWSYTRWFWFQRDSELENFNFHIEGVRKYERFGTKCMRKSTNEWPFVVDHHHEKLEIGQRVQHEHRCEICGHVYTHKHVIKTFAESVQRGKHICPCCYDGKTHAVQFADPGWTMRGIAAKYASKDYHQIIDISSEPADELVPSKIFVSTIMLGERYPCQKRSIMVVGDSQVQAGDFMDHAELRSLAVASSRENSLSQLLRAAHVVEEMMDMSMYSNLEEQSNEPDDFSKRLADERKTLEKVAKLKGHCGAACPNCDLKTDIVVDTVYGHHEVDDEERLFRKMLSETELAYGDRLNTTCYNRPRADLCQPMPEHDQDHLVRQLMKHEDRKYWDDAEREAEKDNEDFLCWESRRANRLGQPNPNGAPDGYVKNLTERIAQDGWIDEITREIKGARLEEQIFGLNEATASVQDIATFVEIMKNDFSVMADDSRATFARFEEIAQKVGKSVEKTADTATGFLKFAGVLLAFGAGTLIFCSLLSKLRKASEGAQVSNLGQLEEQADEEDDIKEERESSTLYEKIMKAYGMAENWFETPFSFVEYFTFDKTKILNLLKGATALKAGWTATEWILEKMEGILESFLSWCLDKSVKLTEKAQKKTQQDIQAMSAMTTLNFFGSDADIGTVLKTDLRRQAFFTAYITLEDYAKEYKGSKDKATCEIVRGAETVLRHTGGLYRSLTEIENPVKKYDPFTIYIAGPHGTGKSHMAGDLALFFRRRLMEDGYGEIPMNSLKYTKNGADEFWSGYREEFFCEWDDIGQMNPDERIKDLFTICSGTPFYLNMADLASKGKPFSSRVLILTSNTEYLKPPEVMHEDALRRRRHFLIRLTVNPKYKATGEAAQRGELYDHTHASEKDFFLFEFLNRLEAGQPWKVVKDQDKFKEFMYQEYLNYHWKNYVEDIEYTEDGNTFWREKHEFPIVRTDLNRFLERSRKGVLMDPADEKVFYASPFFDSKDITLAPGEKLLPMEGSDKEVVAALPFLKKMVGKHATSFYGRMKDWMEGNTSIKMLDLEGSAAVEAAKWIDWVRILRLVVEGVIVLGLTKLVVGLIKTAYQWMFGKPEEQSAVNKVQQRKIVRRVIAQKKKLVPQSFIEEVENVLEEQAGEISLDGNALSTLLKVYKNVVSLGYYRGGETPVHVTYAVFLQGQQILVNKHIIDSLIKEPYVRIQHFQDKERCTNVSFVDSVVATYDDCDYVLCDLRSQNISPYPSIMKHVLPETTAVPEIMTGAYMRYLGGVLCIEQMNCTILPGTVTSTNGLVTRAIGYRMNTYKGDCGLPIVARAHNGRYFVIGIHCLGDGTRGVAAPLNRSLVDGIEPTTTLDFQSLNTDEQPRFRAPDGLEVYGRLKGRAVYIPEETCLTKSPLHGIVPDDREPAILSIHDERMGDEKVDPLFKGLCKYLVPTFPLDPKILEEATRDVSDFFCSLPGRSQFQKVLDEVEILNGTEMPGTGHIDLTTSAGYPWKDDITQKGKRDYFRVTDEGVIEFADNEKGRSLLDAFRQRDHEARCGRRVESYWCDTLKDELLPLFKIKEKKTRIFVIANLPFTLHCRKYFLSFNAFTMYHRVDDFMGPGLIESGVDWDHLKHSITNIGGQAITKFVIADWGNYDKTINTQLIMAFVDVVNNFYNDSDMNQQARRIIGEEIAHTTVIARDAVYGKTRGNPSGNPETSTMNSVIQIVLMRYLWILTFRGLHMDELVPWAMMKKNIHFCVYGDDLVMGISDFVAPYWNMHVLRDGFAKIGMVFGEVSKEGRETPKLYPWEQVTFLKRSFKDFEGATLGVLPRENILRTLGWVVKKGDLRSLLGMTLTSVCFELWKHGEKAYKEDTALIRSKLNEAEMHFVIPSYASLYQLWRNKISQIGGGFSTASEELEKMRRELFEKIVERPFASNGMAWSNPFLIT